VTFNLGVQGDANNLTLYVSRLPREVYGNQAKVDPNTPAVLSDLRRVSYFMAPKGLARYEIKVATTTDPNAANLPPNVPDADSYVISDRVKSLSFSYFDGTNWQDSWDGTQAGPDGTTPQGPPMAIRIEMKIAPAGGSGKDNQSNWKTYRHTIAIPTANRLTQSQQQQQQQQQQQPGQQQQNNP
jgi:hypothetical protein